MKKTKLLMPILGVTTLTTGLTSLTSCGCGSKQPEVVQHTITFSASEGLELTGETSVKVDDGTKWKDVVKPEATTSIEGYQKIGWYNGVDEITDDMEITSDLSAKYIGYDPATTLVEVTVVTAKKEYKDNTYVQGGTWGGFKEYYGVTTPEKEGATFRCWSVNGDEITDDYTFDTQAVTVTAEFDENDRTITFEKTEGVTFDPESPSPTTIEHGKTWAEVDKPKVTVDEDKYFDLGWYIKGEFKSLEDSTIITKDITAKYYAISKEETLIDVNIIVDGETYPVQYIKLGTWGGFKEFWEITEDPEKEGYTFDGWYNGTTKLDDDWSFPETGPVTIEAKFTINQYQVSFKTDAGAKIEGSADPVKVDYKTKWKDIKKPTVSLNPGYLNDAWYDEAGGKLTDDSLITGNTSAIYRTIDVTKTKTKVYIVVDEQKYGPIETLCGITWGQFKQEHSITDPQKEGYYFDGWTYNGKKLEDSWVFPYTKDDVTINANFSISFAADSWANICKYANEGTTKLHEVYKHECDNNTLFPGTLIGCQKTIKLNGLDHVVKVIAENHDTIDGVDKKAALTFQTFNLITYNTTGKYTSLYDLSKSNDYLNSLLRHNLTGQGSAVSPGLWDETALDMIKKENLDLFNNIKTVEKQVALGTDYVVDTYADKLFPLTYAEMAIPEAQFAPQEGTAYEYWSKHTSQSDRIMNYVNGTEGGSYWLVSPVTRPDPGWAWHILKYGKANFFGVKAPAGVSFGFCI